MTKKQKERKAFLITAMHMGIASVLGYIIQDLTGIQDMQMAVFTFYPIVFLIYLNWKKR